METKKIESYKKTVKKTISLARTLVKNQIREIYELGHYLADNVLSKVSMIILAEKNRLDLIFKNQIDRRTLDFPDLYKNMQQNYFSNIKKYEDVAKEFHAEKSMYQARFELLDLTFNQTEAEKYVDFVIDVMRETGILDKNEILPNINILPGSSVMSDSKKDFRQIKYQELYDLLKNPRKADVLIAINNTLDYLLINNLKVDLIMELNRSSDYTILFNSYWYVNTIRGRLYFKNQKTKEQFSYTEPTKNVHVLEDFLNYFKEKVKEKGIIIKE
ncbi:MAG: hypothetical protein ACFE9Q_16105 [Candidatus Hodarchaeota archaeon]